MTEEREIVGFVLPLAAGIAVCTTFTNTLLRTGAGTFSLPLIVFFLGLGWKFRSSRIPVLLSTMAATFFTGIFLLATWQMSTPVHSFSTVPLKGIFDLPFAHEETNALLNALTTGDRSGLSKATKTAFRASGASHLLALSGLHLGILYFLVQKLLFLLGRSPFARRLRYFLLLVSAGSYTLATGASPSLVRAFLFIVLNETAKLTDRPQSGAQILMAALTLQLILTPDALLSTGFQLSYLAVGGIIYLYPRLVKCWPGPEKEDGSWMRKVWNSASLSLSCQLTTGPLAYLKFGSLPGHFLLTNLMAIPLTGLLIPTSLLALLLEQCGGCPDLLLQTVDGLAQGLIRILELIAGM